MPENTNPQYDVDGSEVVTEVLLELINDFPALASTDRIEFATLSENRGKAMFPLNGAVIEREVKDIVGHTIQTCVYPFFVIYRSGNLTEARRQAIKEWLDSLGKWLERQTIYLSVGGTKTAYTLAEYPALGSNRRFTTINRSAPSYLDAVNANNTEDWAISITAKYINEF